MAVAISCNSVSDLTNIGLQYYPSISLLEKGLVWKYYVHTSVKDRQTKTDIRYVKKKLVDQTLFVEEYNAGFRKGFSYELHLKDHLWEVANEISYRYMTIDPTLGTDFPVRIEKNVSLDWLANEAFVDKTSLFDSRGYRIREQQLENIDSISENKQIKIIRSERKLSRINNEQYVDTLLIESKSVFKEGLGLIQRIRSSVRNTHDRVLDELMTEEEFQKRADHGTHRVGYIDTLMTIDNHQLFKPCFASFKIGDYYNDVKAEFKGGKGRLRAILAEKLDAKLLEGESGYLTYRFVINCKGEAGWFVTEEADLEYTKKIFKEEIRMHLYDILKSEKEWTNLSVRNIDRDAYTYITFKIQDGEIAEILP